MSSSIGPFPESPKSFSAHQQQPESKEDQASEASQAEAQSDSDMNHAASSEDVPEDMPEDTLNEGVEDSALSSSAASLQAADEGSLEDPSLASEKPARQQPIPPPSEPMQYRAIGLVRGRYLPSEEQFNRGELLTEDGVKIGAVLLGRVTSLVKKHLDPESDHLWVVYPRTREKREDLHVQIVGVWEPESLQKPETDDEALGAEGDEVKPMLHAPQPRKNYFSVRGEVVYYDEEEKKVIVKIVQAARRSTDLPKSFKLTLTGKLSSHRTVGHFWNLNVERQGDDLVIQNSDRIAMIPPERRKKRKPMKPVSKRGPIKRGNREPGDRPHREFSDRPTRDFSDRPSREPSDRPRRPE